jgi:hypothetical protein
MPDVPSTTRTIPACNRGGDAVYVPDGVTNKAVASVSRLSFAIQAAASLSVRKPSIVWRLPPLPAILTWKPVWPAPGITVYVIIPQYDTFSVPTH